MLLDKVIEKLAALPHVIEVNPDEGYKKAVMNLHNGLLVQLPKPAGFTLGAKAPDTLVISALPTRIKASDDPKAKPQDQGTSTLRYLNGDDVQKILATWTAQKASLGL